MTDANLPGPEGWTGGVLYEDIAMMRLVLRLARPRGHLVEFLRGITPAGVETHVVDLAAADVGDLPDALLRIPVPLARALYDALARHFAGAPADQHARADLLHERGRVDRLIGYLTGDAPPP